MSKVKFNADEMMVMAMFEQPTRTETMRYRRQQFIHYQVFCAVQTAGRI